MRIIPKLGFLQFFNYPFRCLVRSSIGDKVAKVASQWEFTSQAQGQMG